MQLGQGLGFQQRQGWVEPVTQHSAESVSLQKQHAAALRTADPGVCRVYSLAEVAIALRAIFCFR
jgi:hypothetical protein